MIAIGPQDEIYTNDIKSSELIKYAPASGVLERIKCEKYVLGISPSKQFMYFSDKNHVLYSAPIPFNNQFEIIREHVQFVISTFDDNHIYIVDDEFNILLYNVCTKEVEQKSFCDKVNIANVYAQGLYTFNQTGNVFKLNIPAITTFVRRWNLEKKEQEAPTAVCPMCGHQFGLPVELSKVIIDIPSEIKHTEWDNPRLKGHRCPHCGSQLQFNPYISQ
jgi:DNA-directed RNA polymerase subunit RPC12/RpoP